jgi:transposase
VVQDTDLYATILGIHQPWRVSRVEVRPAKDEVEVFIEHAPGAPVRCPVCQGPSPRYDARPRSWRHLDTCQYQTTLTAEVPRIQCTEHGVRQIGVPWAEPGGRFTALFERLAIHWLLDASLSAVARRLRVSWDELDGIMSRAVARGLARRKMERITHLGIDETSFQKRHEYVTVITDVTRSRVIDVADDRTEDAVREVLHRIGTVERHAPLGGQAPYGGPSPLAAVEAVAMDMWKPYIKVVRELVPDADSKICFDRFHVAKHLNEAVNDVRKREHRELRGEGDQRLQGTRFLWLMGPERRKELSAERRAEFAFLRRCSLKVGRAWALKEAARDLWSYTARGWARRAWTSWIAWAQRSRLEPMKKAARMVKDHLWGIINAAVHGVTNATAESLNAKIQRLKKTACGYRNRDRFRAAILFHCGGLDLQPTVGTHTNP